MPHLLRCVLVCFVLFSGLTLAYPFRKTEAPSDKESKTSQAEEVLVLRTDLELAPRSESNNQVRENVKILDIVTSDDVVKNTISRLPALPVDKAKLDSSKRTGHSQIRLLPRIDETVKRLPSISEFRNQQKPKPQARPKRTPSIEQASAKPIARHTLHRIVDGDDLKELAVSYLNDVNRHLEIFELNRDVIRHPDVLPLHEEIKIPVD